MQGEKKKKTIVGHTTKPKTVLMQRLKVKSGEPKVYALYLVDRFVGSSVELIAAYSLEEAMNLAQSSARMKFEKDGMPSQVLNRLKFDVEAWVVKSVPELFGDLLVFTAETTT
jgi:hypothetical protein